MKKTYKVLLHAAGSLALLFCFSSAKGQSWNKVGTGVNGYVDALQVYNGKLYAGGHFSKAGNTLVNYIASTNDTTWTAVGAGTNGYVEYMTVYNGNLIVAGFFTLAGNQLASNIAQWNGTAWSSLGTGLDDSATVNGLAVYNGKLYVGGDITSAGGIPVNNIASWDGTKWDSTGASYANVTALGSYDTLLYAGGGYYTGGYDGNTWSWLGGVNGGQVNAFTGNNGIVYMGGEFSEVGGSNNLFDIAEWNGIYWSNVGLGMNQGWGNEVNALLDTTGILYAAGEFDSADGAPANNIASWNGTAWSPMGSGTNNYVFALAYFNGNLFAGGWFDSAGGKAVNYIAIWGKSIPLGLKSLADNKEFNIYPDPNKGAFTISGLSKGQKVELYNELGQQVSKTYAGNSSLYVDITDQPDGVYLVRILAGDGTVLSQKKIVKVN